MKFNRNSIITFRFFADIISIIIAYTLAIYFTQQRQHIVHNNEQLLILLILLILWFASTTYFKSYNDFRSQTFVIEGIEVIKNVTVLVINTIVILFIFKDSDLSRYFVLLFILFSLPLLLLDKLVIRKFLQFIRKRGRNIRRLLLVGAGEVGVNMYFTLKNNPQLGYRIVGFLDDGDKNFQNDEFLGPIKNLYEILERENIDDVLIALPSYAPKKIENVVRTCEAFTTSVMIIPDYFKFFGNKYNVTLFGRFPIISVREERINELHWRIIKRFIDTILTLFLFITLFWWLWPLIILVIKISSPGPAFYKQKRWGRKNKKFMMYKFRSMVITSNDLDENGKYIQAEKNDPRITKIGSFLRKTNLDELPQFWNVLKGEMSLIGPRPHPEPLNIESKDEVHLYMQRHLVKPGITGWAQVNGCRGVTKTIDVMQSRIDHDVWYIENWSVWLEVQILYLTIWHMLKGDPHAY